MKKVAEFFGKHYCAICIAAMALIYFIKLCSVSLFTVDALYEKIAVCDFPQIVQFVKWHVLNYNGRTLVHCLAILFLRNKYTKILWKLLTSFMIPFSGYLIAKAVGGNKKTVENCAIFSALVFFMTGPLIYTESIYWLAGSFNYFYPVICLIAAIILYNKNPKSVWLFPIALLLGATTEQVGIMAVGVFVLLAADKLISEKRLDVRLVICTVLAAAGYLTVLFSPGTSSRMDRQGNISVKNIIYNFFMVLRDKWFASVNLIVVMALITAFSAYWIIKYKNINGFTKKVNLPFAIVSAACYVINVGYYVFSKVLNVLVKGIAFPPALNCFAFAVWLFCVAAFFLSFAYAAILIYIQKKSALPFISFAIGTGSQMVMGVSTKALFRACFPAVMFYLIYIVFSFKELYEQKIEPSPKAKKFGIIRGAVCVLCILLCAAHAMLITHYMNFSTESDFGEIKPMTSEETKEYTDWLYERNSNLYQDEWENTYKLTDFSKY